MRKEHLSRGERRTRSASEGKESPGLNMPMQIVSALGIADHHRCCWAMSANSITLASYALGGFANFSNIAIQIGGIGALAPERRADLARLGLRSMIAGLLACYLFVAVVGVLLQRRSTPIAIEV